MKIPPRLVTLVVALTAITAFPAAAQRSRRPSPASIEFGPRMGRDFFDDEWTAGGHVRVPLGQRLELRPSGDLALRNIGDHYQLNGDIAIRGPRDQAYIGTGVGWVHRRFKSGKASGTGVNLFVGLKPFPRPGAQLYVEGRWTLVNSETLFRLELGAAIPLR